MGKFGVTEGLEHSYYTASKATGPIQFLIEVPAGKRVKAVYGYYPSGTGAARAEAVAGQVTRQGDLYSLEVVDGGGIMLYVEYEDEADEEVEEDKAQQQAKPPVTQASTIVGAASSSAAEEPVQMRLASTGGSAKAGHALPATSDPMSLSAIATVALAGVGSIAAGRKSRRG